MRGQRLIVYGSLMRGGWGWHALGLVQRVHYLGPEVLRGWLVDLGGYSGFRPGHGIVRAELLALRDPSLLSELDVFEEANAAWPATGVYRRRLCHCSRHRGRAWLYVYNRLQPHRPVQVGRWRATDIA